MLEKFIADGIGWGLAIFAAGFTLVTLTATTAAILAAIGKLVGGSDDENKPRPV